MLFSMTTAEAEAVLWALAHAKPVADQKFPHSCLVAQIEGLSERLAHRMARDPDEYGRWLRRPLCAIGERGK